MNDLHTIQKPELVAFSLGLLWLAFGADIVHDLINFFFYPPSAENNASPILLFVYTAIVYMLYRIGQGRNWARVIYSIIFLPLSLLSVPRLISSLLKFPAPTIVGLFSVFAVVIGVVMLFLPSSSKWFKSGAHRHDTL